MTILVRDRTFRRYWLAYAISTTGSQVTLVAMPLLATLTLHAGSFDLGLITAAGFLPFLALGVPAGFLADHIIHLKRLTVVCDAARGLALLTIPLAASTRGINLGELVAVQLVTGSFTVIATISNPKYVMTLIERDQLRIANVSMKSTFAICQICGPAVAALLLSRLSPGVAITADALSFLYSAAAQTLLVKPRTEPPITPRRAGELLTIAQVTRFVLRDARLSPVLLLGVILSLLTSVVVTLRVLYMVRNLGLSPTDVSIVFVSAGIGGLIGSIIVPLILRALGDCRTIVLSGAVYTASLLAFSCAEFVPFHSILILSTLTSALSAVAVSVFDVSVLTFVQLNAPSNLLGRVAALGMIATQGTVPLGSFASGAAAQYIGVPVVLRLVGSLAIIAAVYPSRRLIKLGGGAANG